jgi:hypothetical protein
MTQILTPTEQEWRTLARLALKEQDPEKLVALAKQIVEAYQGEKRKGPRRFDSIPACRD